LNHQIKLWRTQFSHLVLIALAAYGWVFAIPLMVPYMEHILGSGEYFYKLILISTVVGLSFNLYFGKLVDKISSRYVLGCGLILNSLAWIGFSVSHSLSGVILSFVLEGLSFSAIMVSRSPYYHDLVCSIKTESYYIQLEAKVKKIVILLMVCALFSSGYLYEIYKPLPFLCNAIVSALSFILIFKNRRIKLKDKKQEEASDLKIRMQLKELRETNPKLLWFVATEGLYLALIAYLFFAYQIHLTELSASIVLMSIVISIALFAQIIGAFLIEKKVNHKIAGSFLIALSIATVIAGLITSVNVIFIIFILISILQEYLQIYMNTYIVKNSPYRMRGTIKSFSEIICNVAILISMIVIVKIQPIFHGSGLVILYGLLFAVCFLTWLVFLKHEKISKLIEIHPQ
jgi:MFS family permease